MSAKNMDGVSIISPKLFSFLRELKENNDRDWFQKNKQRYEEEVRNPLLKFIAEFAEPLGKISRHYIADPKPVGGSLFRIYRDVRFSKDKSLYKTHAGIQFRHQKGKDVHAPGFYLHFEPGNVFSAIGVWQPDSASLNKIREAIIEYEGKWQKIFANDKFSKMFELRGDSLKRPPRGYDADHPLIEDLKKKDYYVMTNFDEQTACSADFMETYADACKTASPFMKFLSDALDLEW